MTYAPRIRAGLVVCFMVLGVAPVGAATIPAASASLADVQAAVNATSTGDIVTIPAGSVTWPNTILGIWRGITLQGAGTNATIITTTSLSQVIYVQPGIGNNRLRITGITFNNSDATETVIAVNGPAYAVRVDNCHFNKGRRAVTGNFYASSGAVYGVVDHCSFRNMDHPNYPYDRRTTDGFLGSVAWDEWNATAGVGYVGTTNQLFFEDNHFIWNTGLTLPIAQGAIYGQGAGGKAVFRYNKCNGLSPYGDAHGDGIGSSSYGTTLFEVYKNTFAEDTWHQAQGDQIWMRGGTFLIYSNIFTGVSTPLKMSVYFESDIHRITNSFYWANTWNGSSVQSSQVFIADSGLTSPGYSAANIIEGTHYWLHAPTNGQKWFPYSSAPYPHPLTVEGSSSVLAVQSSTYSVDENVTPLTMTFTRTGGSGACSVNYATANGSAISGVNYTATSGTLNWGDGDFANKTVNVPIINDGVYSANLTFTLTISSPSNATLGTPTTTTVTVNNVNPPPEPPLMAGLVFRLHLGDITSPGQTNASGYFFQAVDTDDPANAGCSTVRVTIPYTATWRTDISVIATNTAQNSGFVDFSTNIVATEAWHVSPVTTGSSPQYRVVSWIGNGTSQPQFPTNTWELTSGVWYFRVCGREANTRFDEVTISPAYPGTIQLSSDVYSANEDAGTVTITVRRINGDDGPAGVTYKTTDGTAAHGVNYTGVTNTLSWATGDTADKTFTVPLIDDGVYGPDLTFNVTLSDVTGGTLGSPTSAVVSVLNVNPPPTPEPGSLQFSAATQSISEDTTPLTVTVRRVDGADGGTGVSYETQDITATAGTDYTTTSGTLSWIDTDMTDKTFEVPIIDNGVYGPNLTFRVILHTPTGASSLGSPTTNVVTILNVNPPPSQSFAFASTTVSVAENGQQTQLVINRLGTPTGAVSVDFYTQNGTALEGIHYTATNGTASFADGVISANIPVPIIDNGVYAGNKSFQMVLTNAAGGTIATDTALITIIDDEIEQSFIWLTANSTASESAATLPIYVRRIDPAGTSSVQYQFINGTAAAGVNFVGATAQGALTFNGSEDVKPITVTLIPNTSITGDLYFLMTLHTPVNGNIINSTNTLCVITDDDFSQATSVRGATFRNVIMR